MELVNRTLADCLSETAEKYPANIALEQTDWTCTFRELMKSPMHMRAG